MNLSLQKTQI